MRWTRKAGEHTAQVHSMENGSPVNWPQARAEKVCWVQCVGGRTGE